MAGLQTLEARQTANIQPIIAAVMTMLEQYRAIPVTPSMWINILKLMFPTVEQASRRSAINARDMYDEERQRLGLPHHPIPLATVRFDQFVKDMEPVRKPFMSPDTSSGHVHQAALRVARTVENSGRWTVMKAVEYDDPGLEELATLDEALQPIKSVERQTSRAPSIVKGWARVATGKETCGWCIMLVSRGPVYKSAKTAGASLSDTDAMHLTGAGEFDPSEHMLGWHTGCDCKVVPVFKLDDWEGKDRYEAAERLWHKATRNYSGNDATNAFRRAVEAGEYQRELEVVGMAA